MTVQMPGNPPQDSPAVSSTLVRVVTAVEELRQAVLAHAQQLDQLSALLSQIKGDTQ